MIPLHLFGLDKSPVFGSIHRPNLVNASGVVGSDVSGVGTARNSIAGVGYGGDKGAFAYGTTGGTNYVSLKNLLNSSGVIAADVTGVGTARATLASAGYSLSA